MAKKLGTMIDQLYKLKQEFAVHEAKGSAIKKKIDVKIDDIFKTFKKADIDGAKGGTAIVALTRRDIAVVNSWPKLYSYIGKNKAYELLQKRISITAIHDRLDDGKKVPGVALDQVIGLRCSGRRDARKK